MKSMTGYGKAICNLPDKKITIEIKSVNSKQFDLNLKIPQMYRDKDADIRSQTSKILERGKVEMYFTLETLFVNNDFTLNKDLAKKYYADMKQLADDLCVPMTDDVMPVLMRMPDIVKTQSGEVNDAEWWQIAVAIEKAIMEVDAFRKMEGAVLCQDISERIEMIQNKIPQIETFEKERMEQIRRRISNNIAAFVEQEKIDTNRFEQELIYYLEKIDFTEEKIRLQKHCSYFSETLEQKDANGRKLAFIAQEIGREINTLGSKANDAGIQKIVVEMKDELEKIKEQLLNVL